MMVDPADPDAEERATFEANYDSVTDVLTLYVWREPAFHLTRWAARARLSHLFVTFAGAVLAVLAFWLFWRGAYWPALLLACLVMVVDIVEGQLARLTGAPAGRGNFVGRGIDLVLPPFWCWGLEHGLAGHGRAIEPVFATMIMLAIIVGHVAQRGFELLFLRRYQVQIDRWRPIDSKFRLISAGRNLNVALLFAGLLLGRPDWGLELVAWWTIISLIFYAVRLAQAKERVERGRRITSWLQA